MVLFAVGNAARAALEIEMSLHVVTCHKLVAFLEPRCIMRALDAAEDRDVRASFASVFGLTFAVPAHLARGKRAESLYAAERPGAYVVMSQPLASFTPHASCSPLPFSFLCEPRSDEPCAPLGALCALEPCIVAADFSWAMIHTHEDHQLDGPYFVRAESLF